MPVANLEGVLDGALRLVRRNLEDPEAELRDRDPVDQLEPVLHPAHLGSRTSNEMDGSGRSSGSTRVPSSGRTSRAGSKVSRPWRALIMLSSSLVGSWGDPRSRQTVWALLCAASIRKCRSV